MVNILYLCFKCVTPAPSKKKPASPKQKPAAVAPEVVTTVNPALKSKSPTSPKKKEKEPEIISAQNKPSKSVTQQKLVFKTTTPT